MRCISSLPSPSGRPLMIPVTRDSELWTLPLIEELVSVISSTFDEVGLTRLTRPTTPRQVMIVIPSLTPSSVPRSSVIACTNGDGSRRDHPGRQQLAGAGPLLQAEQVAQVAVLHLELAQAGDLRLEAIDLLAVLVVLAGQLGHPPDDRGHVLDLAEQARDARLDRLQHPRADRLDLAGRPGCQHQAADHAEQQQHQQPGSGAPASGRYARHVSSVSISTVGRYPRPQPCSRERLAPASPPPYGGG